MTLGSHQRSIGRSQVHLTPRWLLDDLGYFDLDPCAAPEPRPWPTAHQHIALPADGLAACWSGRVWLNPPFDRRVVGRWLKKLAEHGDGIALIHARTETKWFAPVWAAASAILFLSSRISFCGPDGRSHPANSGAPLVLAAFGQCNALALKTAGVPGRLVTSWEAVACR